MNHWRVVKVCRVILACFSFHCQSFVINKYSVLQFGKKVSNSLFMMEKVAENRQKRGIFWDVDGTLCDSHALCFTSTNYVLQNHCKSSITEEQYHEGVKFTTPRRMAWHFSGDPDDAMGETLGREFDELYVQLVSRDTASFYPGIKELLHEIALTADRQVYYATLSNACTDYVEAVLRVHEVADLFPIQLGADKVPKAKPAPEGLLECCSRLNLAPTQCIYVGDSPTDGQAAKHAGMKSIGVTWGSHSLGKITPHFDHIVQTREELKDKLLEFLSSTI